MILEVSRQRTIIDLIPDELPGEVAQSLHQLGIQLRQLLRDLLVVISEGARRVKY